LGFQFERMHTMPDDDEVSIFGMSLITQEP